MITSKNIPLFLRSISFSCKPKLIQSVTPNHECRAPLLSMWHLTRRQHCSLESWTLGDLLFQAHEHSYIYTHDAVPDLLLMALRYVTGTQAEQRKSVLMDRGFCASQTQAAPLGRWWCVEISLFSVFPRGERGDVQACRWLSPPAFYCRAAFPQQEQGNASCLGTGLGSLCGSFYPCAKQMCNDTCL